MLEQLHAKQWPPPKMLLEVLDDLHAAYEATNALPQGIVGGNAALGRMRKAPTPHPSQQHKLAQPSDGTNSSQLQIRGEAASRRGRCDTLGV